MEDLTSAAGYYNQSSSSSMMMKQPEQEQLKCPRCDSSNTKFCYYNNYNLSQPRHFCKNCRRYWTKGGSLRNIPVGGGIRKITKRTSSSSSSNLKNQKPSSESGSGSDLKDEKKVTGQEMDPTRMLYGLPVGDSTSVSFSSLLVSDIYETEPGWISGMGLVSDSQKRDDDTWTDLTMKRVEMN